MPEKETKKVSNLERLAEAFGFQTDEVSQINEEGEWATVISISYRKYRIELEKLVGGPVSNALLQRVLANETDTLTVKELRKIAGEMGVSPIADLKKEELIAAIQKAHKGPS